MNSLDLVRMGSRNLFRRKARTFLTVLGVIIGTSAIVVMLSLGIGMNEGFNREVQRMGSLNIINVDPYYMPEGVEGPAMRGPEKRAVLDDKAVAQIAAIEGVEAATPIVEAYPKFVSGKYVAYGQLRGIDTRTMEAFEFKVDQGRLLQEGDTMEMVFGCNVAQNFFNPKTNRGFGGYYGGQSQQPPVDVMNNKMQFTFDMSYGERRRPGSVDEPNKKPAKLYKVKAVGLLAQSDDEKDYCVYMDINQLKKLMREYERSQSSQGGRSMRSNEQQGYQRVMVKVAEINDVDKVQKKIKEMGFGAYSLSDIRKSMQKTASTVQTVLGGIGAISLLIAALGITNTMIMSIYERTREIGIMKVLGCMLRDIKRLFLFEAGMIGFMGGIAGIGLSYGTSALLNYLGPKIMKDGGMFIGPPGGEGPISIIPLWLAFASVGFAIIIGLISGYYPARRAMKLSALEAIRAE